MNIDSKIHYIMTQGYDDITKLKQWESDAFYLSEAECEIVSGGVYSYFINSTRLHVDQLIDVSRRHGELKVVKAVQLIVKDIQNNCGATDSMLNVISDPAKAFETFVHNGDLGVILDKIYRDNGVNG